MTPRWMKVGLVVTAVVLLCSGLWFYHAHNKFLVRETYADLESEAQLKVDQIVAWRNQRLGDAAVLTESPSFSREVARWLRNPEPGRTKELLTRFRSVQRHYGYSDVFLLDATGAVRLSTSGLAPSGYDAVTEAIAAAFRERKPMLTDLHRTSGADGPHLDAVAPIFFDDGLGAPAAAIVLRVEASHFLYPLLQSWPISTRTGETLLVERYGDDVLFMNELRHQKGTALTLRLPLSRKEVPAVMAVLGQEGVVRGNDYRGMEVLSALKKVPGAPWFMVAKIDTSEAFSGVRRESVLVLALTLGLIALAAAFAGMVWQRNAKTQYRALFRAESAQRKSEERFRVTLLSVGDAVIATDVSGRVELLNPVAERLTGWQQADALGRPVEEVFAIINEKTRHPAQNPVERVLREGGIVGLANSTALLSRDGREIPIEDSAAPIKDRDGAITGVVLVFHDVTEKRKAVLALRDAHDQLELRVRERTAELARQAELINLAQDAIIVRDMEDRITFWSRGAEGTYGWASGEATGNIIHLLLKTEYPDGLETMKAALLSEGRWEGELIHSKKDGTQIPVMSRRVLRRDENGCPSGILEISRDITELKRIEQQLRQAQKIEALGTLTGGVAHDFNNILAAVIGFGELAHDVVPEGTPEKRYLGNVLHAALRGRDLIRQMLTFARKGEQEKRPLQLSSPVKETVKLLRASIPSSINVRLKIESEFGFVLADPVQIQQVILNLCTNAAYAMREKGGTLEIELSDCSVPQQRGGDGMHEGSYVQLLVRDTGAGIPANIIDRIFDPFFSTKPQGDGTGLGLSVVHGIVKSHEGLISVESEPGSGTTFKVCLPKTSKVKTAVTEPEGPIPTGHERILLIDDEPALAEAGGTLLGQLGYQVITKTNSREALAIFRLDPSRFDLIIADQTMREMTGLQLAAEVLGLRPDMPVIVCTGFSSLIDADSAKAAGIRAFLLKPLTRGELARTVRKVLDK